MPALVIVIVILFLLFKPNLLPGIGTWLGSKSRKPVRQARWMWSSCAGTEDESIQAEREYGAECARAFRTQFSSKTNPEDQELLDTIGAQLAHAVQDTRWAFRFTAVHGGPPNAYALPGGFVFITQPLLDLCNRDRNEIAFFLGHEIGHVIRGHARDQLTANTFLNAVASRLPAAGQMLRHVVSKGYSRIQELEADREAVRLAAAAGFDALASISALERLSRVAPDPSGLAEYLSSHPPFAERIHELRIVDCGLRICS